MRDSLTFFHKIITYKSNNIAKENIYFIYRIIKHEIII